MKYNIDHIIKKIGYTNNIKNKILTYIININIPVISNILKYLKRKHLRMSFIKNKLYPNKKAMEDVMEYITLTDPWVEYYNREYKAREDVWYGREKNNCDYRILTYFRDIKTYKNVSYKKSEHNNIDRLVVGDNYKIKNGNRFYHVIYKCNNYEKYSGDKYILVDDILYYFARHILPTNNMSEHYYDYLKNKGLTDKEIKNNWYYKLIKYKNNERRTKLVSLF